MKRSITVGLQVALLALGICALILMIRLPLTEGRNVNATLFEVYFKDPFLAYAYASSITFFVGLYQAIKLLGYMGQNETFSFESVKALRVIKRCAISLIALIIPPLLYLFIIRPEDDIAGGVAMGLFLIMISVIVTSSASIFERFVQRAMSK